MTIIRAAKSEDYDQVGNVFAKSEALHRAAEPRMFQKPDGPALSRAFFDSMLTKENAALFVAEQNNKIIGYVFVKTAHIADLPLMQPRRWAEVDMLVVLERARHAGIGRTLMAQAEQWGSEQGLDEIQLNVWEFNEHAIAFYEQLGYGTMLRRMRRIITNAHP